MTGRILVVDDEEIVRRTLAFILADYAVTSVGDGREALQVFQEQDFDLLIVDLNMPHMSGDELLEQIHRIDPDMPVIILTGYATMNKAIEALRAGAYDFLTKPIENPLLIQAAERALKNRRLVVENKHYLERLKQFNAELERKVGERTRQLSGMNEIHHYIASNVFDIHTVLTFAAGAIVRALDLTKCVIYVKEDGAMLAPRAGSDGAATIPAAALDSLPTPTIPEADEILGPGLVFLGDGEGAIQVERAPERPPVGPGDLELLRDFDPPIRLAVKLARIYENIAEDPGGADASTDADTILAEIEALDHRGDGSGFAEDPDAAAAP